MTKHYAFLLKLIEVPFREMEANNHPTLLVFLSAFSRVAKLRSRLCASCYTTEGKQKSCPIMDDYLFPAPLF